MLYYRIEANLSQLYFDETADTHKTIHENNANILFETECFNAKRKECCFFVSNLSTTKCHIGAICKETPNKSIVEAYLTAVKIKFTDISITETTIKDIWRLLRSSGREKFINDDYDIISKMDLNKIINKTNPHAVSLNIINTFGEKLADADITKTDLIKKAHKLMSCSLETEITRIFEPKNMQRFSGHPVHYLIESDDRQFISSSTEILISSLYKVKRLKSLRYMQPEFSTRYDTFFTACHAAEGGALCCDFTSDINEDFEFADDRVYDMDKVVKSFAKYHNDVLYMIHLPKSCNALRHLLFSKLPDCTFVEIKEDFIDINAAKEFLISRAKENGITPDDCLTKEIIPNQNYTLHDLNRILDKWTATQLKTKIYPAYADLSSAGKQEAREPKKGNAYTELQNMVGLSSAKAVIEQVLAHDKAQKLFHNFGISEDNMAMHMVFTGNPGTAKTTVARLFARIMKDNGLLSEGRLLEVGRADLVGRYVGWTARIVKEKFNQAKGSVLFIDEAYSLLDDRSGMYGDEAINTIVQEMENNREDVIVIFAGYPREMESFLSRNPGLRSRIAYHIPFEDYTAEELVAITEYQAKNAGRSISDKAKEKLLSIYKNAAGVSNFGNGRYARNILESAMRKQAQRLLAIDYDKITQTEVITLEADDFEEKTLNKPKEKLIGFI